MAQEKTFNDLGLDPEILAGIAELGFEIPTPVQAAVIPRLLESNRDFVGLAQTGTGKTAAFGLPAIQQADFTRKETQVLILCPTRELCLQITRDLAAFGKHKKAMRVLAVYGGSPIEKQIAALNRGVQIIVATPGRINDLLRRKKARLDQVQTVVLDEADEMLNMGFQEDLETILKQVPDSAQTLLFSATMPRQVAAIAGNYMHDAEEVTIGTRNAGAENVTHVCYTVHAKDRYLALKRIADFYPDMYGIVFCRTRIETQDIADRLMKDGYNADSLHGDLTQARRDHVMQKFRQRSLQMLVATDVAARGLDVNDLTHIINYNLPDDLDSYTHRSGRTGRAGKDGISVAIVHMREKSKIRRIERIINKKFEHRKVPSGRDVCAAQLIGLIGRVKDVDVDHDQIDPYMADVLEMLEGMSREELIKHFVSMEFNRFLAYYRRAPDLNADDRGPARSERRERPSRRERQQSQRSNRQERPARSEEAAPRPKKRPAHDREGRPGYTRLFINLGRKDRLSPKDLRGIVGNATDGQVVETEKINIQNTYSFVEVKNEDTQKVIKALRFIEYGEREVRVEPVDESRARQTARPERRPPKHGASFGRSRPHNAGRKRKPGKIKMGSKKGKPHRKGGPQ